MDFDNQLNHLFGIVLLSILFYIWIKTRKHNETIVNDSILEYYHSQDLRLKHISPLKMKEKLHYGIPILNYYNFYVIFSQFTPFPMIINRKVELMNKDGDNYLKYVEINIFKNAVQEINEFDSYEI